MAGWLRLAPKTLPSKMKSLSPFFLFLLPLLLPRFYTFLTTLRDSLKVVRRKNSHSRNFALSPIPSPFQSRVQNSSLGRRHFRTLMGEGRVVLPASPLLIGRADIFSADWALRKEKEGSKEFSVVTSRSASLFSPGGKILMH